jgi:hypothetical protein
VLLRLRQNPDLVLESPEPVVENKAQSKELVNHRKKIKLISAAASSKRLSKEIHNIPDPSLKFGLLSYVAANISCAWGYWMQEGEANQAAVKEKWMFLQALSCVMFCVLYALKKNRNFHVNIYALRISDRVSLANLLEEHKQVAEDKMSLEDAEKSLFAIYNQSHGALKSRSAALTFFLRADELKPKGKKSCSLLSLFRCKKQKTISLPMPLQNKIAEFLGCEDLPELAVKLKSH